MSDWSLRSPGDTPVTGNIADTKHITLNIMNISSHSLDLAFESSGHVSESLYLSKGAMSTGLHVAFHYFSDVGPHHTLAVLQLYPDMIEGLQYGRTAY